MIRACTRPYIFISQCSECARSSAECIAAFRRDKKRRREPIFPLFGTASIGRTPHHQRYVSNNIKRIKMLRHVTSQPFILCIFEHVVRSIYSNDKLSCQKRIITANRHNSFAAFERIKVSHLVLAIKVKSPNNR